MITLLLSVLAAAFLAPWIIQWKRSAARWFALIPFGLFLFSLTWISSVAEADSIVQTYPWMPSLGLSLSFLLDGLSLLFVLLITGIGTFIVWYASDYLKHHPDLGRFYFWLLLFMFAMLGLVISDNLIALFVFWELTSITSYMLIGFNHESAQSRKLALQGLFVTVGGGLVLMTGFILLGQISGTYQLSAIIQQPINESPWLSATLVLILVGAFTKSAQFPFHFWLPNAMAAPTPVSAFLHSATMVKAGVFLMARLHPAFFEQPLWSNAQMIFGTATMFIGAWLAWCSTDIKKVFAYTTVMALGTLTLLLGIGSDYALVAFVCYLLGHSLYKASLFMIAGGIDHSAGTRDLTKLSGLRSKMPVTFVVMVIGALSLAGLPPMFGFIGKELLLEAGLGADIWVISAIFLSSVLVSAVAIVVVVKPFFGKQMNGDSNVHESSIPLLAGPVVLLSLSLVFGLVPMLAQVALVNATLASVSPDSINTTLKLFPGINTALGLSFLSLIMGIIVASGWKPFRFWADRLWEISKRLSPEAGYFAFMDGIASFAGWQTRVIQNGRLGSYMTVLILATLLPVAWVLLDSVGLPHFSSTLDLTLYEWGMVVLMLSSTAFAVITRSRFASIISLGALGFSVALIFVHFSAPDLGITQVLVETLTVLLLVLVLVKVPGFARYSSTSEVVKDATVALFAGTVLSAVVMAAIPVQWSPAISSYFIDNSYELGKGRNIVNVILVDFRALDTLGEIFVLAIAALGIYSMMKLKGHRHD